MSLIGSLSSPILQLLMQHFGSKVASISGRLVLKMNSVKSNDYTLQMVYGASQFNEEHLKNTVKITGAQEAIELFKKTCMKVHNQ